MMKMMENKNCFSVFKLISFTHLPTRWISVYPQSPWALQNPNPVHLCCLKGCTERKREEKRIRWDELLILKMRKCTFRGH